MKFTLSLAQMDVQLGNPQENLARVSQWCETAAGLNSDLLLLPELWSTGYDLENWQEYGSPLDQGHFRLMANLARQYGITIGGSLIEIAAGQAYNTFALFGADGSLQGKYRKIHLFGLMGEDQWLGAGDRLELVETWFGLAGLTVCYDLRFPEMFRSYALKGAQAILLVAEWPSLRIEHWRTLLRARAIENQLFMIAVNRVGSSKGETFGGHSAVIDPKGEVIVEGGLEEALLTCTIDTQEVEKIRSHIPVFADRRSEVY